MIRQEVLLNYGRLEDAGAQPETSQSGTIRAFHFWPERIISCEVAITSRLRRSATMRLYHSRCRAAGLCSTG